MEIKDIIKKRREELNLTYEQLGNMVGVGKSTVRKWETGMIENMRRDNIIALSKALNISPAEIMGWTDNSKNQQKELQNLKLENDLKEIIISKYNNIQEFCDKNNLIYSKVDKIFKKGIGDTNIQLILKICSILDIDADSILKGEIHFNNPLLKYTKIPTKLNNDESALLVKFNKLDINDQTKVVDYTNLLLNQDKYKENPTPSTINNELCATISNSDTIIEKSKEEKSERLQDYFTTIAAHNDDLTEEEKIIAEQKVIEALKKAKLI